MWVGAADAAELEVGLDELVRGFFCDCWMDARAAVGDVCGQLVQRLFFWSVPRYGQGGRGQNGMETRTRMSSPPVSGLSSM